MPNFDRYVPNAVETKTNLKYQFWGRATLDFSPTCSNTISDAVDVLNRMDDSWDFLDMNLANLIVSSCILGIEFIWMIIATCCFCTMREQVCGKVHTVFYSSFFLAFSIAILVMSSIELAGLKDRSDALLEWSAYADCVDTYMQINGYQVD